MLSEASMKSEKFKYHCLECYLLFPHHKKIDALCIQQARGTKETDPVVKAGMSNFTK